MTRLHHLAALILAIGACNSDRSDRARASDRAADKVVDKQQQMRPSEKQVDDLAAANAAFDAKKELRLFELRAERATIAATPTMVSALAAQLPIDAKSRIDVEDRVKDLQARLDDANSAIDQLAGATAETWKTRDDTAIDQMKKVEDARDNAWAALKNAHRTDRSS